jgi:pimeloyl-ACP methyl ester carboxylesterase
MLMRRRNGSSEFHPTGSLKDWSAVDIVGKIEAETLVINGVEEGPSDEAVRPFVEGIRNVEWIKLKGTTHMPMYEDPERYFEVVVEFLTK